MQAGLTYANGTAKISARPSEIGLSGAKSPMPWNAVDALLCGLIILLGALYFSSSATPLVDDSLFYLRIAKNISENGSFSFNVGEYVNSATSTTYVLLFTVFSLFAGLTPRSLEAFYIVTICCFLIVQYAVWRRFGRWQAFVLGLVSTQGIHLLETAGMESALLLTLVCLTAWQYERTGSTPLTGLLAGLAALTRPEGLSLIVIIGALEWWRSKRVAWGFLAAACLPIGAWVAFSRFYFGTVSSHTAEVKVLQRHYGAWAKEPNYLLFYVRHRVPLIASACAAAVLLVVSKTAVALQNLTYVVVVVLFGISQLTVYAAADVAGYFWYFVSTDLALTTIICLALVLQWQSGAMRRIPLAASIALALFVLRPWHMLFEDYRLGSDYKEASEWVKAHSCHTDEVAAAEIGYVGWFSGLKVLDVHGLIHNRALPALRAKNLHWWWDDGERPRFVIAHDPAWDGEPGSVSWPSDLSLDFAGEYEKVLQSGIVAVFEKTTDVDRDCSK